MMPLHDEKPGTIRNPVSAINFLKLSFLLVNSRVLQELLYAGLLTPGETLTVVATGLTFVAFLAEVLIIFNLLEKPGVLGRGRVGVDGTLLDEDGRSWSSLKGFSYLVKFSAHLLNIFLALSNTTNGAGGSELSNHLKIFVSKALANGLVLFIENLFLESLRKREIMLKK
jgi:hypothetical protein